jgi:hypothetical protein
MDLTAGVMMHAGGYAGRIAGRVDAFEMTAQNAEMSQKVIIYRALAGFGQLPEDNPHGGHSFLLICRFMIQQNFIICKKMSKKNKSKSVAYIAAFWLWSYNQKIGETMRYASIQEGNNYEFACQGLCGHR